MMKLGWKLPTSMLLMLSANAAYADESTDERITQLQKMLEDPQGR